jgi:Zn-dependent metalloprotease
MLNRFLLLAIAGMSVAVSGAQAQAVDFSPLEALKKLTGLRTQFERPSLRVQGELIAARDQFSDGIHTQRFQHRMDGVVVLGSQALRHVTLSTVQGFLGLGDEPTWTDHVAQFDLNTTPSISEQQALEIALQEVPGQDLAPKPQLLILPRWSKNSAELIYRFEIAGRGEIPGRIVDVNAHSGRLVASISRHWDIAPIDVYTTNKKCQTLSPIADDLGGRAPISVDYEKCLRVIKAGVAEPNADDQAVQAFANSQTVLNYYWQTHQRDSYDNQGSPVVSVVHIGDKWTNAFWDSENNIMAYGDGDGKKFRNLTLSLDVAGHEMTHGVVSKTANLEYQSESGATNEGLADFFGESIEGHKDWVMGRELFIDPAEGVNGLRNLFDPHKTTYRWKDEDGNAIRKSAPAHLSEIFTFDGQMCGRANDNCGVHMNATLVGHAGYLAVKALGREKAEKIFYANLVHFLTETSDFKAFGEGARKACAKLYGQADCDTLNQVLVQVGL